MLITLFLLYFHNAECCGYQFLLSGYFFNLVLQLEGLTFLLDYKVIENRDHAFIIFVDILPWHLVTIEYNGPCDGKNVILFANEESLHIHLVLHLIYNRNILYLCFALNFSKSFHINYFLLRFFYSFF